VGGVWLPPLGEGADCHAKLCCLEKQMIVMPRLCTWRQATKLGQNVS
jgi:hypothetical protein